MASPRVFLVGYMAAGKSCVGRALARLESRPFVDTDALVSALARRSIGRIIAAEGEEGFRRKEARALARAARVPGAVVAVGGGAVLKPENRALMRKHGTVVWLQASYATAKKRAAADGGAAKRPLLAGGRALFTKRRAFYAKAAHFSVRSDVGTVSAVARRVSGRL